VGRKRHEEERPNRRKPKQGVTTTLLGSLWGSGFLSKEDRNERAECQVRVPRKSHREKSEKGGT